MLTTLSNSGVPVVGTAAGFLKSKAFLVLAYCMIGVAVSLGGYALSQVFQKQKVETKLAQTETQLVRSEQREGTLEGIVQQQVSTIGIVTEMRESDAEMAVRLLNQNKQLEREKVSMAKRLATLERENESVRKYLDSAVPPDLACMLAETCAQAGAPGSGEVRKADTARVP